MHFDSDRLLASSVFVDHADPGIQELSRRLAASHTDAVGYVRAAFEFVRDEIPHTATTDRQIVTAKASDVLAQRTGICHAKANLLTALLRAHGIPAGFGFQHLTVEDDESEGYCLHAFTVAFLDGHPIALDPHPNVRFSVTTPRLAHPNRPEYDEYTLDGWWTEPDSGTMDVLTHALSLDDALRALPDQTSAPPDGPHFHP